MKRQPAPGVYERLITRTVEDELQLIEPELLRRARLNPADSHEALARHVAALTRRALRAVADRSDERESLSREIALANQIATAIGQLSGEITDSDQVITSAEQLLTGDKEPRLHLIDLT